MALVLASAAYVVTPRYGIGESGAFALGGYTDADGGVRPLRPSGVALANSSAVIAAPVVAPVAAPIDGETATGSVPGAPHRPTTRERDIRNVRSGEIHGRGFDRRLARVDRC